MTFATLVPPFVLAGVGMGLVFAPMATAVLARMPERHHAKASGTNSTMREVGGALGIAVLTVVFTSAGGELTPAGYVDAAIPAIATGGAVLAAAFALAFLLPAGRSDLEDPVAALEQPEAAEAGPSGLPIPVGAGATA